MGVLPQRPPVSEPLQIPGLEAFDALLKGTEEREIRPRWPSCACSASW